MHALETCVYCPKLCRSECPVSNVEPRETLTPWGKMSMTHFVATERVAASASFAEVAWACTGCRACANACDHKNDVAGTLLDARAALSEAGLRPPAASRVVRDHDERVEATSRAVRAIGEALPGYVDSASRTAVLVGCSACRHDREGAESAVRVAARVAGTKVRLVEGCCGASLEAAGDRRGLEEAARAMAKELDGVERAWVVDPGCALTMRESYARVGVALRAAPALVVEEAAKRLAKFATTPDPELHRFHDPCKLGRGLGVYEAPRALLARVLGRAPAEFRLQRARSTCAGGGGLLPATYPQIAEGMARARAAQHEDEGGGVIVTACSGSRRRLSEAGARVVDLYALLDRASSHEPVA